MEELKLYYDKNAASITIPNGITMIPDEAFMNFDQLEEVIIPDSVTHIGKAAFKGCKSLKKVKLPNQLQILDDFAFSECSMLEEITIPSSLHYYAYGLFSHCHHLKKINTHDEINYINDLAFYNCKSLEDFSIPRDVTSIQQMAFMGCNSIQSIHIPKNVDCIEFGAFALMNSLEKITVDTENENFFSANDDTVLISKDGMIIQYAIHCEDEEFVVGYYTEDYETTDENGNKVTLESPSLIYNIADYAFAGAKNLKKLYIPSELESIGGKTFLDCKNLKDLEIFHTSYGDSFLMHVHKPLEEESDIPFENIVIHEGVQTLCGKLSELFKNARSITLPSSLESIGEEVFTDSKDLSTLTIPDGIKSILPNTFYPEMNITFPQFGTMKAKTFNMLQTKTSENRYIKTHEKDNIKIFSLKDGAYYVQIDDFDTVKVNRDEISALSNSSSVMADQPDDFVMYLIRLLMINIEYNRILSHIWTDPKLEEVFVKFVNDCNYVQEISSKKTARAIREIIDYSGVADEFLFSGMLMRKIGKEDLKKILSNYNNSISRFFRLCNTDSEDDPVINVDHLISYCNLLEKYQRYDRFLYRPVFFEKLSGEDQELLVKYYNKNMKHLLKNSQTLDDMYGENLNDLFKLCQALGIFSDDERISQRMITFLNERMLNPKGISPIVGDDIHTMFGEIDPREDVDYEFIMFFVENYERLIELEKSNSGIIARIYNDFRDISKTSTSHRGEQRHLKVTIDKCLDYFLAKQFDGITEENKELAMVLQKHYSENYALSVGEMILKQSQEAPRNIFTPVHVEDGEFIYSYDPNEDLREQNEDGFSYHWLPKQDYDNLILGKYCSCCAHILGAGAGIMRASMILDNCQNLVIRNHLGEIIAKMTIYVNQKLGYAVFNTAEIHTDYRSEENLDGIYRAFMRGVDAFIHAYNQNNHVPISIISIGEYRNTIKNNLGNVETELLPTPNYSNYGYYAGGKEFGTYNGDSKKMQILVYQAKRNL